MPRSAASVRAVESALSRSVRSHGLNGSVLLVAASSGADSTALLHALHSQGEALGLTLQVAHFDHNFRPEAAEDARFVENMALALELPFITEHADPIVYQREHGISSFEAAARELRYRFLGRAAASVGASAVALGHNADDQAETVLMHLLRGTGLDGLRGMDPLSLWHSSDGLQHVNLFRPLLTVTKDQLRRYCEENDIPYREDPANLDMRFTRNRVRHQLLPSLRQYNPRISQALLRLSQAVTHEVDFLESETDRAWAHLAQVGEGVVSLHRPSAASLPVALQLRLLRKAYETVVGSGRRLQASHLDAMMSLLQQGSHREVVLPFGLRASISHETMTICRSPAAPSTPFEGEHRLALPNPGAPPLTTRLPGWVVTSEWVSATAAVPADPFTAILDTAQPVPDLRVRARRRGDRFHPYGMPSEKKLQDFFVDRKIPASQRDSIPLLFLDGRLAWVVGYRVAHWAAVTTESRHVVRITFTASLEAQSCPEG